MADSIADPTTITNEQLAGKVVESVKAVQDAELTVVAEGKKLVAHMADPNAHGQDVGACITQAIADHEGNTDAHGLEAFKTGLTGTVDTKLGDLRTELSAKLEGLNEPTLVRTDDIRLSDARPPLTHDHDAAYAAKTHQHSPNDLNAVVPLAKGGTGNTTGNAVTATQLQTPRTISLSGGVTGTATSFNGSANVTIPVMGLDMAKATAGTLPVARGGTGRTDGKTAALATMRNIALTGAVAGSANFDGSANITINTTRSTADASPIMPTEENMYIYIGKGYFKPKLPDGGTWAYFLIETDENGFISTSNDYNRAGVASGGSTIGSGLMLAWRIA